MAAYVILTREKIPDAKEMESYVAKVASGFVGHPVRVLATHTRFEVAEGPPIESVVLLEFPTLEDEKCGTKAPHIMMPFSIDSRVLNIAA
jgi:uncharacterized protein (DUF1330 family)